MKSFYLIQQLLNGDHLDDEEIKEAIELLNNLNFALKLRVKNDVGQTGEVVDNGK